MKTTLFARHDIAAIVRSTGLNRLMDETIDGLAEACLQVDAGHFSIPLRSGFQYSHPRTGLVEWMPAMRMGEHIVVKMVGYHPENPQVLGVPTILSTVLVFDPASGHLCSIIDGTFLTALRTGAASALASRYLMRSGSETLGLIGAGAQAVTQLHALSRVMPLRRVHVFDTDAATGASFIHRIGGFELPDVDVAVSDLATASACDVVCTATSVAVGAGPVLSDQHLQPSVHINAVGSDFPGKTELPQSFVKRAVVCPDFRAQAMLEGECQQLKEAEVGPDLLELVRRGDENYGLRNQATVFDSTGWALEDFVVAQILTRYGQALGVGQAVALESLADDPKDPYGFVRSIEDGLSSISATR